MIDIFSRRVVGWLLSAVESEDLAADLVEATGEKYQISPNQLTLHADLHCQLSAAARSCLEGLGEAQEIGGHRIRTLNGGGASAIVGGGEEIP